MWQIKEPLEVLNGTNQIYPLPIFLYPPHRSSPSVLDLQNSIRRHERHRETTEALGVSATLMRSCAVGKFGGKLLMKTSIQRERDWGHEDQFQPLDCHWSVEQSIKHYAALYSHKTHRRFITTRLFMLIAAAVRQACDVWSPVPAGGTAGRSNAKIWANGNN